MEYNKLYYINFITHNNYNFTSQYFSNMKECQKKLKELLKLNIEISFSVIDFIFKSESSKDFRYLHGKNTKQITL